MRTISKLLLIAIAALGLSKILPGVHAEGLVAALFFAITLAVLNITVKPILKFFTLPISCLTFGAFLLVINTLMIKLADWWVTGFKVEGWMWAFILSVALSLSTYIIEYVLDNVFGKKDD